MSTSIPTHITSAFLRLLSELSPENLYCDGQLSGAVADWKYFELMNQWRELERQVGRRVQESEFTTYIFPNR